MSVLGDFLSKGPDRRRWLEGKGQEAADALQYYLGPGVNVNALAQIADMFNPVADIGRAGTAARGVVRPGATISERVGALGNVATDMASVLAPVAGAAYADDAARGLTEALANWSMPADDMATRFVADESGAIRAWHGSPHDFDRFSMDKIGTGEGAQAYGHGLYFAESPAVAQGYRDKLSDPNWFPSGVYEGPALNTDDPVERLMQIGIGQYGQNPVDEAIKTLESLKRSVVNDAMLPQYDEAIRRLSEAPRKGPAVPRLYEVNIDANPEDFLDWDAPLSAQPERIRAALEPLMPRADEAPSDAWGFSPGRARASQFPQNPLGADFVRQLPDITGDSVEDILREQGIPGIRYLDAGSRGAGDGSRNYVVFDDRLISILNKYGLAGLGTGAALNMQQPSEEQELRAYLQQ